MSLDGAKFICLDEEGEQCKVIGAKGRKFSIGYYMSCDLILDDTSEAKGLHCEINCDAFGRVTIHNKSEENPVRVNDQLVVIKRPLLSGSKITILDKNYLWDFPRVKGSEYEQMNIATPEKQIGIPEQPPNSCPDFKVHRDIQRRLTVHNFAYSIHSDEEGNSSVDSNQADENDVQQEQDNTVGDIQLELVPIMEETALEERCVTPASSLVNTEETPKMNLINCTKNKENSSTEKKMQLISLCQLSDIVVTSFSPYQAGIRAEKTFAAVLKQATPKSVYSTPKSILSELNDEGSRDFIDFSTPATSKKTLLRQVTNSPMHLVDLTTPTKIRPASPYPKSAERSLVSRNTTKKAQIEGVLPESGVRPIGTPLENDSKKVVETPNSVISLDSSESVVEVSLEESPATSSAIAIKTPNKPNVNPKITTPKRTPHSLMKRALLTSAKKQSITFGRTAVTTPTRSSPQTMSSVSRKIVNNQSPKITPSKPGVLDRQSVLTSPLDRSLLGKGSQNITFASASSKADSFAASRSISGRRIQASTSTPLNCSTATLRTSAKSSPLRKVRKSFGGQTLSSHISKNRNSLATSSKTSPTLTSSAAIASAKLKRKSLLYVSPASARARAIVAAATPTSILKSTQKQNETRKAVLFSEKKENSAEAEDLNTTFTLETDKTFELDENVATTSDACKATNEKSTSDQNFTVENEQETKSDNAEPENEGGTEIKDQDAVMGTTINDATFSPVKVDKSTVEDQNSIENIDLRSKEVSESVMQEKSKEFENGGIVEATSANAGDQDEANESIDSENATRVNVSKKEEKVETEPLVKDNVTEDDHTPDTDEDNLIENKVSIQQPQRSSSENSPSEDDHKNNEVSDTNVVAANHDKINLLDQEKSSTTDILSTEIKEFVNTSSCETVLQNIGTLNENDENNDDLLEQIEEVLNKSDELQKHLEFSVEPVMKIEEENKNEANIKNLTLEEQEEMTEIVYSSDENVEIVQTAQILKGTDDIKKNDADLAEMKENELKEKVTSPLTEELMDENSIDEELVKPVKAVNSKATSENHEDANSAYDEEKSTVSENFELLSSKLASIDGQTEPKTPNLKGIKELLKTPKRQKLLRTPNFIGVRNLMRTPKTTNIDAKSEELLGVEELLKTPGVSVSLANNDAENTAVSTALSLTPRRSVRRASMSADIRSPPMTPKRVTQRRSSVDSEAVTLSPKQVLTFTPRQSVRRASMSRDISSVPLTPKRIKERRSSISIETEVEILTPRREKTTPRLIQKYISEESIVEDMGVIVEEISTSMTTLKEKTQGEEALRENQPEELIPKIISLIDEAEKPNVEPDTPKQEAVLIEEGTCEILEVSECPKTVALTTERNEDAVEISENIHISKELEVDYISGSLDSLRTHNRTSIEANAIIDDIMDRSDYDYGKEVKDLKENETINEAIEVSTPKTSKKVKYALKTTERLIVDAKGEQHKTPKSIKFEGAPDENKSSTSKSNTLGMQLKTPKGCSTPHSNKTSISFLDGIKELMDSPTATNITDNEISTNTCDNVLPETLTFDNSVTELNQTDDEGLDKFFRTPRAKNVMVLTSPKSVNVKKTIDSVELLHSKEFDLDTTNVENLEDIFKTPVAAARFDEDDETTEFIEDPNAEAENNVKDLSAEEAFDELVGLPSNIQTPARKSYERKSLIKSVPNSPFTESDVLSDLPKTDIQEWVDSLEDADISTVADIEFKGCLERAGGETDQEITMIENENEISRDPLAASLIKLTDCSSKHIDHDTLKGNTSKAESSTNISAFSLINDPLSSSSANLIEENIPTVHRLSPVDESSIDKVTEISGINILDQTDECESLFSEALLLSDSDSNFDKRSEDKNQDELSLGEKNADDFENFIETPQLILGQRSTTPNNTANKLQTKTLRRSLDIREEWVDLNLKSETLNTVIEKNEENLQKLIADEVDENSTNRNEQIVLNVNEQATAVEKLNEAKEIILDLDISFDAIDDGMSAVTEIHNASTPDDSCLIEPVNKNKMEDVLTNSQSSKENDVEVISTSHRDEMANSSDKKLESTLLSVNDIGNSTTAAKEENNIIDDVESEANIEVVHTVADDNSESQKLCTEEMVEDGIVYIETTVSTKDSTAKETNSEVPEKLDALSFEVLLKTNDNLNDKNFVEETIVRDGTTSENVHDQSRDESHHTSVVDNPILINEEKLSSNIEQERTEDVQGLEISNIEILTEVEENITKDGKLNESPTDNSELKSNECEIITELIDAKNNPAVEKEDKIKEFYPEEEKKSVQHYDALQKNNNAQKSDNEQLQLLSTDKNTEQETIDDRSHYKKDEERPEPANDSDSTKGNVEALAPLNADELEPSTESNEPVKHSKISTHNVVDHFNLDDIKLPNAKVNFDAEVEIKVETANVRQEQEKYVVCDKVEEKMVQSTDNTIKIIEEKPSKSRGRKGSRDSQHSVKDDVEPPMRRLRKGSKDSHHSVKDEVEPPMRRLRKGSKDSQHSRDNNEEIPNQRNTRSRMETAIEKIAEESTNAMENSETTTLLSSIQYESHEPPSSQHSKVSILESESLAKGPQVCDSKIEQEAIHIEVKSLIEVNEPSVEYESHEPSTQNSKLSTSESEPLAKDPQVCDDKIELEAIDTEVKPLLEVENVQKQEIIEHSDCNEQITNPSEVNKATEIKVSKGRGRKGAKDNEHIVKDDVEALKRRKVANDSQHSKNDKAQITRQTSSRRKMKSPAAEIDDELPNKVTLELECVDLKEMKSPNKVPNNKTVDIDADTAIETGNTTCATVEPNEAQPQDIKEKTLGPEIINNGTDTKKTQLMTRRAGRKKEEEENSNKTKETIKRPTRRGQRGRVDHVDDESCETEKANEHTKAGQKLNEANKELAEVESNSNGDVLKQLLLPEVEDKLVILQKQESPKKNKRGRPKKQEVPTPPRTVENIEAEVDENDHLVETVPITEKENEINSLEIVDHKKGSDDYNNREQLTKITPAKSTNARRGRKPKDSIEENSENKTETREAGVIISQETIPKNTTRSRRLKALQTEHKKTTTYEEHETEANSDDESLLDLRHKTKGKGAPLDHKTETITHELLTDKEEPIAKSETKKTNKTRGRKRKVSQADDEPFEKTDKKGDLTDDNETKVETLSEDSKTPKNKGRVGKNQNSESVKMEEPVSGQKSSRTKTRARYNSRGDHESTSEKTVETAANRVGRLDIVSPQLLKAQERAHTSDNAKQELTPATKPIRGRGGRKAAAEVSVSPAKNNDEDKMMANKQVISPIIENINDTKQNTFDEAEILTTSRGRVRKPTARAQQFLEEERARASTPKKRLLLQNAESNSPTPQKLPARRGRKPSTIESEIANTPQQVTKPRLIITESTPGSPTPPTPSPKMAARRGRKPSTIETVSTPQQIKRREVKATESKTEQTEKESSSGNAHRTRGRKPGAKSKPVGKDEDEPVEKLKVEETADNEVSKRATGRRGRVVETMVLNEKDKDGDEVKEEPKSSKTTTRGKAQGEKTSKRTHRLASATTIDADSDESEHEDEEEIPTTSQAALSKKRNDVNRKDQTPLAKRTKRKALADEDNGGVSSISEKSNGAGRSRKVIIEDTNKTPPKSIEVKEQKEDAPKRATRATRKK